MSRLMHAPHNTQPDGRTREAPRRATQTGQGPLRLKRRMARRARRRESRVLKATMVLYLVAMVTLFYVVTHWGPR